MNATEIKAMWVFACQYWPNYPIPADPDERVVRLQVWTDTLGDLESTAVRAALVTLSESEWFPPLGVLRSRACEIVANAAGVARIPDVDEAWAEVMEAIHNVGRYGSPKWSHPALTQTMRAIGWLEVCNCTDLGVMRGQFFRFYANAQGRAQRDRTPPPPALAAFMAGAVKRVDEILEIGPGS